MVHGFTVTGAACNFVLIYVEWGACECMIANNEHSKNVSENRQPTVLAEGPSGGFGKVLIVPGIGQALLLGEDVRGRDYDD